MALAAKPLTEFDLFTPPASRWTGPVVDAHMHSKDLAAMARYFDVADPIYGVRYAVPIVELATGIELKQLYGDRVQPAIWGIHPRIDSFKDLATWRKNKEELLDKIAEAGFRIVKLWFTPRFHEMHNVRLDDPILDFFFERLRKNKLSVLIHVADPDYWFAERITDVESHGTKAEHYPQLLYRMALYPDITFQGAHFAGHPEDLDHLSSLLDRFPNYYFDSSATKWIAREFTRHGWAARDFLMKYSDRILFGTDLVADPAREKEGQREHYATRFYVHRLAWEGRGWFDSPIEDEDSPEPPRFQGLSLPTEVLGKFYWRNAARLYGFAAAGV